MKYFIYNESSFTVSWIIIADDKLSKFRTSKKDKWEMLDKERRDTLLRCWQEVSEEEALLELI
jgi:hypothetical protein